MSEETTTQPEGTAESTDQPAAVATLRRRAPKQDGTLAQAVDIARQAVVDSAGAENVGEHLGIDVHEDRLLTHLFECTMSGYPGWTWFATVARAPRTKLVTVCEVGLLAGENSLLAPDWVPWEERMQAVHDQEDHDQVEESGSQGENPDSPSAGSEAGSTETTEADATETGAGQPDEDAATEAGTTDENEASS